MKNKNLNNMLIDIAKGAIYSKLYDKNIINKEELIEKFPNFLKRAATFVTITIDGELRGCIGSLIAHKALLDDILSNAVKAAFSDPRFPPLTKDEFKNIDIEKSTQNGDIFYVLVKTNRKTLFKQMRKEFLSDDKLLDSKYKNISNYSNAGQIYILQKLLKKI